VEFTIVKAAQAALDAWAAQQQLLVLVVSAARVAASIRLQIFTIVKAARVALDAQGVVSLVYPQEQLVARVQVARHAAEPQAVELCATTL
jgi:hypothetical protein